MRIIKINLIPKKPGMKMPKVPYGTIAGILIILGAGYFMWGVLGPQWEEELDGLRREKKELNKKKEEQIKKKQEELDVINGKIAAVENKVNLIEGLISTDNIVPWTDVLETMTKVVPKKKIWLTRFQTEAKYKVNMLGRGVDAAKNISEYWDNLSHDPIFAEVFLHNANHSKQNQQEIWDFKMSCQLKKRQEKKEK